MLLPCFLLCCTVLSQYNHVWNKEQICILCVEGITGFNSKTSRFKSFCTLWVKKRGHLSILSDLRNMSVMLSPKPMRHNSLQKGHKYIVSCFNKRKESEKTHAPCWLKSTVAQPSMKPGSLVNHRTTSRTKMMSTANSANFMRPSLLYSSFITLYASLSLLDSTPQPNDFFRLRRKGFKIYKHGLR